MLALALAAGLSFDALAYRGRIGTQRFDAEIAALQQRRAWLLSAAEAERLAAMQTARDEPSAPTFARRMAKLRDLDRLWRRQLAEAQGPAYRTEWLNGRWLNDAMTARDADARELLRRTFLDQFQGDFAIPDDIRTPFLTLYAARQGTVQRGNAEWLKRVLARIGWFDVSRYGAEASQAAWLIVQHADFDPAWQRAVLVALEPRVARGDMQGRYYAYLADRVVVNGGEPQAYGTQGRCAGPGNWQPFALADPERLDERRREVGLESIAAYRAKFTCR